MMAARVEEQGEQEALPSEKNADKRKRGKNLSNVERELIMDLALKYKSVIENKKTDCVNAKKKEEAWRSVETEFNAVSTVKRDWCQIRQAYENVKKKTKKDAAFDKIERYKTGGGTFVKKVDATGEKVLSMLGNRVKPLVNPFDSDAAYNFDTSGNQDSSNLSTKEFFIEIVNELPGSSVSATKDRYSAAAVKTEAVTSAVSIQSETGGASSSTLLSGSLPSRTPSPINDQSGSSSASTQWSQRRRPSLQKTRTSISGIRAEATSKISALADGKATYYKQKLEMEKEEHAIRMRVLAAQEELYRKKLAEY